MGNPKSDGRMINKDISESDKFASLTPEAAVLFAMLIPHLNAHGKLNGGPGYIKEIVCFKIPYLSLVNIPILLEEISKKTNVKWFKYDGRDWIHSIKFLSDHQKLDPKRLGRDLLPTYSGVTQDLVIPEVEVEVEVEERREVLTCSLVEPEKPETQNPSALAEHTWEKFRAGMPLRSGKFIDEDACRQKWARSPAIWNQVLEALPNYSASAEVHDGKVMSPMKFISGRFKEWLTPETQPLGPPSRAPDYSWKAEDEQFERERAEHQRQVDAGKIKPAGDITAWRKTIQTA